MTALSAEAKAIIAETHPGLVASADGSGRPNVSAKGSFRVLDDEHVLFADVNSPRTIANLLENPQVSAMVFDPATRHGCRVWGKAEVLDSGELFDGCISTVRCTPCTRSMTQETEMLEPLHTSCGYFHCLAFWMEEVGALGVMHRGFAGRAPNGETWDTLANKAGGKQWPGVTYVGPAYLASPSFLLGDGGLGGVAWMTRKAREVAGPGALGIPTEEEATP